MTTQTASVDILVIGGGIQGLLALRQAQARGLSTMLIEVDRLGGGVTRHSQAILHRGFVYSGFDVAS